MRISFYGAANEVTGSCYLVETQRARVLVDCGMFQGSKVCEKRNHIPHSLEPRQIDAVVLTHGHLDHCGRLPLLGAEGYSGHVFATAGTTDIARLILTDAAKIQLDDAEHENKHRRRLREQPVKPLFTQKDVNRIMKRFCPLDYDRWQEIAPGISIRLVEAGHILGSACVEMEIRERKQTIKVVFSGDIGQWNMPIMRDPARIEKADVVILESTYGNRDHRSLPETISELEQLIHNAVRQKGKVLIPTFAVGRAQEVLYHLAQMFREKRIPSLPIYLDSPMAISATELYARHSELMDAEAKQLYESGQLERDLRSLRSCQGADESKNLNDLPGPCIILAGAGMCNAGRILHHFRHNLSLPETQVVIVGYQAKGSLGRELLEGVTQVKIHGETVHVRANVKGLGGFSAHAGRSDLLRWLEPMANHAPHIILTHGENNCLQALAREIAGRFSLPVEIPKLYESIAIDGSDPAATEKSTALEQCSMPCKR